MRYDIDQNSCLNNLVVCVQASVTTPSDSSCTPIKCTIFLIPNSAILWSIMLITIFCFCLFVFFTLQVGKAMSSNESAAYEIMKSLDVDYVLIIFGGVIGYSGDDINKFLWMVRIAEGEHPKDIRVRFLGNHDGVVGVTFSAIYSY